MNIENYTWIVGKTVHRPWEIEYRYTVKNNSGKYFDSIVPLENDKVEEITIAELITNQLLKIDVIHDFPMDPIEEAKIEKENEIQEFLVTKELLTVDQEICDIKSKTEILAEKGV